jgi:hypothetical protein
MMVIVERWFSEPADIEELQAQEDAGHWCLDLHGIRFLRTYMAVDRTRFLCLYEAADTESVRIAQRTIGLPYERIWAAEIFDPPVVSSTGDHDDGG